MKHFLALSVAIWVSQPSAAVICSEIELTDVQDFLKEEGMVGLLLIRHGRAEQAWKKDYRDGFDAETREGFGPKVEGKDEQRELEKRGKRDAKSISKVLRKLDFDRSAMLCSSAHRCFTTGFKIFESLKAKHTHLDMDFSVSRNLYHQPIDNYIEATTRQYGDRKNVIWLGHYGKFADFYKNLAEQAKRPVIPTTAAVGMFVKGDSIQDLFTKRHENIYVFAWSPKGNHELRADSSLESVGAEEGMVLESMPMPGLESVQAPQGEAIDLHTATLGKMTFRDLVGGTPEPRQAPSDR